MTEAEWLACTDPGVMVEFLRGSGSLTERKARLCAVAWARSYLCLVSDTPRGRSFWPEFSASHWLPQLETAERYADGQVDRKALRACRQKTGGPHNLFRLVAGISHFSLDAIYRSLHYAQQELGAPPGREVCDLTRCIFGLLPFRPLTIDAAWLSWNHSTVKRLAEAVHDERSSPAGTFDRARMAILADALQEAGCTNEDILSHCRVSGLHVRGCWLVDLLVGKE